MKRLEISGQLLARNTLLNFIGQAVPLVVGVVTIPFIVQGLGKERFGLLSLRLLLSISALNPPPTIPSLTTYHRPLTPHWVSSYAR